jgi:hypothetical protein
MFSESVIRYGVKGYISYELSTARMFNDNLRYGVTTSIDNKIAHELNDLFDTLDEAELYINNNFKKVV